MIELESVWLSQEELRESSCSRLEQFGWTIQIGWQESLTLSIESSLIERWLGDNRPYQQAIENSGEVGQMHCQSYAASFCNNAGRRLPQSLRHWRIEAAWPDSAIKKARLYRGLLNDDVEPQRVRIDHHRPRTGAAAGAGSAGRI